jgi:cytochrome subunit of sulfide dehydrogenase
MTFRLLFLLPALLLVLGACQSTTPQSTPSAPAALPAPILPPTAPPPAAAAEPAKAASSGPAVSPEAARNIANNCFTCHGPDGKSPGTIPTLSRFNAERIASKLKGFRSGAEPSTVMGRHTKAYSDAEIEAVADYIAARNK